MDFLISNAWAANDNAGGGLASFVMLLIFIGLFYFLLIRPQTKRQKEHRAMVDSLQKGDEVLTSGGVLGKISEMGDNYIMLEIADGVVIKVQRQSVGALVPKGTFKSTL